MYMRILLALLACALLSATGCDTVKPYWKGTKKLYKEYVNTDPTIDLKDTGSASDTERKMADEFTPVDEKLEFLLRALSAQDLPPEQDWCQNFMATFPWLTGMAVLSDTGAVNLRLPGFSLKPVDYSPLMEFDKRYKARKMAAAVATSELGAEIMVAKPLFVDSDFKGLLVVQFDPGSLVRFSPDPQKLILVSPGNVLWAGDDAGAAQALSQVKWDKVLKNSVGGEEKVGGVRYLWQARFIGQTHLIYAVSAVPKAARASKAAPEAAPAPAPAQTPDAAQEQNPAPAQ